MQTTLSFRPLGKDTRLPRQRVISFPFPLLRGDKCNSETEIKSVVDRRWTGKSGGLGNQVSVVKGLRTLGFVENVTESFVLFCFGFLSIWEEVVGQGLLSVPGPSVLPLS